MKENEKEPVDLPENAFRELEEGEEYNPIMSPGREYREVTPWSVSWGIVMAVLFSAAAAYLGLKVGLRSCHTYRHYSGRTFDRVQAEKRIG